MNSRLPLLLIVLAMLTAGCLGDAAEEASIDNALEALATDAEDQGAEEGAADDAAEDGAAADEPADEEVTDDGSDEAVAEEAAPLDDVTGSWAVNTDIGEFDFGDATSTFVGFRVDEELASVGQTEAIGRSAAVSGTLEIDGTTLQAAQIDVDFSELVSDIPNRDGAMKRAIGAAENPIGSFVLSEPVDFGEVPAEGESVTFTAVGDLTVNGITSPFEFDMEAQVAQGNILVVGSSPVVFEDFDVTAPQAGPVISIDDEGTIEMQLWFSAADA